jgi:hypothetical protein
LRYETLSCNRIINFVKMIEETDNLEEIFTESQIDDIQRFMIFLMRRLVIQ